MRLAFFYISLLSFLNSLPWHWPWPLFSLGKHKQAYTDTKPDQPSHQSSAVFQGELSSLILYLKNLSSYTEVFFACLLAISLSKHVLPTLPAISAQNTNRCSSALALQPLHITAETGRSTKIWNKSDLWYNWGMNPVKRQHSWWVRTGFPSHIPALWYTCVWFKANHLYPCLLSLLTCKIELLSVPPLRGHGED